MEEERDVQGCAPQEKAPGVMAMVISELFAGLKSYVTTSVDEYTQQKIRMLTRKVIFGVLGFTGAIFMLIGGAFLMNDFLGDAISDGWGYVIVGGITAFVGWIVFGREEL